MSFMLMDVTKDDFGWAFIVLFFTFFPVLLLRLDT
jgi:hypothetical protein